MLFCVRVNNNKVNQYLMLLYSLKLISTVFSNRYQTDAETVDWWPRVGSKIVRIGLLFLQFWSPHGATIYCFSSV